MLEREVAKYPVRPLQSFFQRSSRCNFFIPTTGMFACLVIWFLFSYKHTAALLLKPSPQQATLPVTRGGETGTGVPRPEAYIISERDFRASRAKYIASLNDDEYAHHCRKRPEATAWMFDDQGCHKDDGHTSQHLWVTFFIGMGCAILLASRCYVQPNLCSPSTGQNRSSDCTPSHLNGQDLPKENDHTPSDSGQDHHAEGDRTPLHYPQPNLYLPSNGQNRSSDCTPFHHNGQDRPKEGDHTLTNSGQDQPTEDDRTPLREMNQKKPSEAVSEHPQIKLVGTRTRESATLHWKNPNANILNGLQIEDVVHRTKELNKKYGFELTQMDRLRAFLLQGKKPESERGKECSPLARDLLSMLQAFAKMERLSTSLNPFQKGRSYRLTRRMVYAVVHYEHNFCSTSSQGDLSGFTESDFRDPPFGSLF